VVREQQICTCNGNDKTRNYNCVSAIDRIQKPDHAKERETQMWSSRDLSRDIASNHGECEHRDTVQYRSTKARFGGGVRTMSMKYPHFEVAALVSKLESHRDVL